MLRGGKLFSLLKNSREFRALSTATYKVTFFMHGVMPIAMIYLVMVL